MPKYVKNTSGADNFFAGVKIKDGNYYLLDGIEEVRRFATNETFLSQLTSQAATMASDNTGTSDIPGAVSGFLFLFDIEPVADEPVVFVGGLMTKRLDVFKYRKKYAIPSDIKNLTLKNIASVDVCISFNDDVSDDYFTLASGETTKILGLTSNKKLLKYVSISDKSKLEIIMWG